MTGPLRPVVVGVAFGAAWSPCVGPLLGAALTVAAGSGDAGRGAVLLFAYALGIGVPFVLASLGLASSPRLAGGSAASGPGSSGWPAACWSCSACSWPPARTAT